MDARIRSPSLTCHMPGGSEACRLGGSGSGSESTCVIVESYTRRIGRLGSSYVYDLS